MNCPHCNEPLGDKATFCPNCNKIAIPTRASAEAPKKEDKPPKKVAQRIYPPQKPQEVEPEPPEAKPVTPVPETQAPSPALERQNPGVVAKKQSNGWKNLSIVLVILTLIAAAVSIYITVSTHGMRVELTKAQTERASAQATVESLGKQVAQLEDTLESTRQERDDLKNEAASLCSQVNAMESTVNQSTYDKDAAQRELEAATEEKDALADQVTELETSLTETQEKLAAAEAEKDTLQKDNTSLKETVKANETEISFYDSYVVFVMLSSDNKYYHKYDCSDFTQKNFLAYSTKLAEANGYSPCPKCCE